MPEILLVLTHCPDAATATRITAALLDQRLAACVSEGAPVRSTYRWRGALESAVEIPLQIKCTSARYPEVEQAIREMHPYDVPEIVALSVVLGHGPFLRWVDDETRPPMVA